MSSNTSNTNNNNSSSTAGSSGDGFWAKNGPSIMSATGSALSTTFKAGKYVAKTGYAAGKSHYNNQKGKTNEKKNGEQSQELEETIPESRPVENLKSVESFNPPPLRPGQMQYQKGGNIVEAGDKPIPRQHVPQPVSQQPQQQVQYQQQQVQYQQPQYQQQQQPVAQQPSTPANIIAPTTLQPLYNAEGAIIGYIPMQPQLNQQTIPTPVQQTVPTPVSQRAALPTPGQNVQPAVAQEPVQAQNRAPAPLPARPDSQHNPLSILTAKSSSFSSENEGSIKSKSPHFGVTPYEFKDPEEREKEKKLVVENKIDVNVMPPPPMHRGRGSSLEKKFSERVEEKIKAQSSTINTYSHSPTTSNKSSEGKNKIPKIDTDGEEEEDGDEDKVEEEAVKTGMKHNFDSKNVSLAPKIEIKLNDTGKQNETPKVQAQVLGKYDYSKKVEFQPPPQASVPEGFVSPSMRIATMKQEAENKRNGHHNTANNGGRTVPPTPPISRGSSNTSMHSTRSNESNSNTTAPPPTARRAAAPPPVQRKPSSISTTSNTNTNPDNGEKKPVIQGSYDYNKKVDFQPPPMAKRSDRDLEYLQHRQERTRITSNANLRPQQPQQQQSTRRTMTMLEPEAAERPAPGIPQRESFSNQQQKQHKQEHPPPPTYSSNYGQSKASDFTPPPKPVKPSELKKSNESSSSSLEKLGSSNQGTFNIPPLKPVKPSSLSTQTESIKDRKAVPPPKPTKPKALIPDNNNTNNKNNSYGKTSSSVVPPPKPNKPGMLKAPPKPKKPASLQVEKSDSDDNPFAKYDPKSAV